MASLHIMPTDMTLSAEVPAITLVRRPLHSAKAYVRTRLDPYPRRISRRWILRFVLAIPYLVIALLSYQRTENLVTPNALLLERIAAIPWDRGDVGWVGEIYPPLSTVAVAAVPGGQLGVAILGALVAGAFIQKMIEIMVQRRFPTATIIILIIALTANPLFAYTATENFAAFLGLAFFGLGMAHIVRFVAWGSTQSGFRAGTLLMLATLADLSGVMYVLTAAAASPFLRLGGRGYRGARGANVLVIVFPTIAATTALVSLNLVFLGSPFGTLGERTFAGSAERLDALGVLLTRPGGWLLIASVVSAWLIALIVRRPGSILVSTLVFIAILTAQVIGLIPAGSTGNTFILMTLMAIALIPVARTRWAIWLTNGVAALQILIAWASAFNREATLNWINALLGS